MFNPEDMGENSFILYDELTEDILVELIKNFGNEEEINKHIE